MVNVITLALAQSDHIKRLTLYLVPSLLIFLRILYLFNHLNFISFLYNVVQFFVLLDFWFYWCSSYFFTFTFNKNNKCYLCEPLWKSCFNISNTVNKYLCRPQSNYSLFPTCSYDFSQSTIPSSEDRYLTIFSFI